MLVRLPQLVVSRDGRRAVLVDRFGADLRASTTFDGFPFDSTVRLQPRGERSFFQFKVSGSFQVAWDITGQTLKWDENFRTALPALALIALGRFLDDNALPSDPADGEFAMTVPVFSDLFDIFKQRPPTGAELYSYVRGKIYWAFEFGVEPVRFESWETYRLRVAVRDFDRAAFRDIGLLWEKSDDGYRALPALARQPMSTRGTSTAAQPAQIYDVALSFAGEQRPYVSAVAAALREGGATVFYDGDADLWGKDLTKELERVYHHGSRFIVIFVSEEYVQKAWPNLERQHALAGRIERMDDSVLPARFAPISLPGLPSTVGYLDIGMRSPQQLAELVLAKLRQ